MYLDTCVMSTGITVLAELQVPRMALIADLNMTKEVMHLSEPIYDKRVAHVALIC